jgi:hypothetical protein
MSISSIVLAALLSSSHHVHTVEGSWPTVSLGRSAHTATVTVAYPEEDGKVDAYMGSFTVRIDPALRALQREGEQAHGRVRLARADGERVWHVVAFVPDSPAH